MLQKNLIALNFLKSFIICGALVVNTERAEVAYYNPKYVTETEIHSFFFNRTMRMVNTTNNFLVPINSDNDYLDGVAYIFLSNRYVLSGIQGRVKIKDIFNYPFFNIKYIMAQHVTPPMTKWPIEAGKYLAYNLYISSDGLPNIPEGRYKVVIKLFLRSELATTLHFYVHLH